MPSDLYQGLVLGIATSHGKEQQIGPVFQQTFGISYVVPSFLPTDTLGTFSGEIPRIGTPVETARQKIAMARHEMPEISLWIASEGSFGPHPTLGFLPSDEEILVFQDVRSELEITARVVSLSTNYRSAWITNEKDLLNWAQEVLFPSHALILAPSQEATSHVVKGIQNEQDLLKTFRSLQGERGGAWVMTDMRAMMNPTRQQVIKEASEVLVKKIGSRCPVCQSPGYEVQEVVPGLPCAWCGQPTRSALEAVWGCSKCQHTHTQLFPHGREVEDPGSCDYCNP